MTPQYCFTSFCRAIDRVILPPPPTDDVPILSKTDETPLSLTFVSSPAPVSINDFPPTLATVDTTDVLEKVESTFF